MSRCRKPASSALCQKRNCVNCPMTAIGRRKLTLWPKEQRASASGVVLMCCKLLWITFKQIVVYTTIFIYFLKNYLCTQKWRISVKTNVPNCYFIYEILSVPQQLRKLKPSLYFCKMDEISTQTIYCIEEF